VQREGKRGNPWSLLLEDFQSWFRRLNHGSRTSNSTLSNGVQGKQAVASQ
jgi:hypothetical protein